MRKVEIRSGFNATPSLLISAFTDPEMLRQWWGVERALVETKKGGLYILTWNISQQGFGFVTTGIVQDYDPGGRLVITQLVYLNPARPILGPMSLFIEATRGKDDTAFYLCQDGYGEGADWDWYYEAVSRAWPAVIDKLKTFLDSNAS
jgi:uncharacterized protein YndB with AHSA1/START domain